MGRNAMMMPDDGKNLTAEETGRYNELSDEALDDILSQAPVDTHAWHIPHQD